MSRSLARFYAISSVVAMFALVFVSRDALAEETEEEAATLFPVPDYSGDLTSRPRASGSWGGHRQHLADKGVQVEIDFVPTFQKIVDGDIDEVSDYAGTFDYVLKIDVEKLGLWPGAFVMVRGETLFGDTMAGKTGSLMASSVVSILPLPESDTYTDDGQGFEIYYNIALTPWWHLTPDLPVLESAIKQFDTAIVLGLRTEIEL